ncbi:MAG: hypothetical protein ACRCX8_03980 [Sarcina sp.]
MKIKTLTKLFIIPMIAVTLLNIDIVAEATTKVNYREISSKYFTSVIDGNYNDMIKYSTDVRYDSIKERKAELPELIENADKLIAYEILEDENPHDNKIVAMLEYDNGEITEISFEIKNGKVEIGHDLNDVGRIISEANKVNTNKVN